ncbi:MAG: endonuclease/exonuclease/phosphatase family protein [Actinomycetota bacterium]
MRRFVVALLASALALGACGGDDDAIDDVERSDGSSDTTIARGSTFSIASLNVLHGIFCPDGDHCDAPNRIALLAAEIEAAGCPDVIALQEVAPWIRDLVSAELPSLCTGDYREVASALREGSDGAMMLASAPTDDPVEVGLAGGMRAAVRVDVGTELGTMAIVSTHTGTGADDQGAGGGVCADTPDECQPPCDAAGTLFECQLVQVRELLGSTTPALIVGDLNLVADAPPMQILYDAGFVDTHLAAGKTECEPATGANCTSGRVDTSVAVLRDPDAKNSVRVDYVLLHPASQCDVEYGHATGVFAAEPALDGPGGLAWISDHVGASAEFRCA